MKTSIATVSLSGGLAEKWGTIAERGFGAVEIFENALLPAPQSAKGIGDLLVELRLACSMFQPFRDYEGLPAVQKLRALERMRRKFAVMDDLGTGRTKDVVRWQQGDINRVINSEPEGLAHSFDMIHGGSVCAIGLATSEPHAVIQRAEALGIPRFEQAVRPDEWQIPAVRGVGGSLFYLVETAVKDAMWRDEFPHEGGGDTPRQDLTRVDHIAQTMQYDGFLSWGLYYSALFGFTRTPQLEIADPMGTVYSQAFESPSRAVRFTLNGSMATNALSTRFIQNYFGTGVQHVAFATADIFSAAEHAKSSGLPLLEIGPNYYADLEARFGLDAALVARMAALNILYDRDDQGEYFQFYSRAIAKRVFFEVVERRGYDAYGAANASIRLWIATICGFMALYFITKLSINAGFPETQAIIASAIYNLGAFVGTLGMSLAGTTRDIRKICSGLLIASAGVFLIFGGVSMPLLGVLATAFVMGITLQGGFNSLYPIAARVYPDAVRATGIGWAFGIGRIGAFSGPLIGGYALSANLPLVAVFGIFCVPLTIAAISARSISFGKL